MAEKCVVCKTEINLGDTKCPVCGFADLHKDFISKEDAENWMKAVVEPYREKYNEGLRKSQTPKYDSAGFDEEGYNKEGFNRIGYNRDGFDRQGYDRSGYNKEGFNKITGLNREGYDRQGYDKEGYGKDGFNRQGYNKSGYDRSGYNSEGLDSHGYDRNGYDKYGYDKNGYNRYGYDKSGYNRNGYNAYGYDKFGFDKEGYDKKGFNKNGINKLGVSKDEFDAAGYHKLTGFNNQGYNREGYDINGYNSYGKSRKQVETIQSIANGSFVIGGLLSAILLLIYIIEGYNSALEDYYWWFVFGIPIISALASVVDALSSIDLSSKEIGMALTSIVTGILSIGTYLIFKLLSIECSFIELFLTLGILATIMGTIATIYRKQINLRKNIGEDKIIYILILHPWIIWIGLTMLLAMGD